MKKFFVLFVAVLMALASFSALAEDAAVEPLYAYDAETAAEQWKSFTGTWSYTQDGISCENDGNDVWYFSFVGTDAGWTDYVVEADLKWCMEGGILFRVTDPAPGIDTFGGYFVGYDSAWAFFGMDSNDAWMTVTEAGPDAPSAAATPYADEMHWKLVVKGNTATLYIDDMETPYMSMTDDTYTAGGVGIRVKAIAGDDPCYFKNLTVYPIAE